MVMEGARALALPLRYGQELSVIQDALIPRILVSSYDEKGNCWFESRFDANSLRTDDTDPVSKRFEDLLNIIGHLKPASIMGKGLHFTFNMDFNRKWGLGSSSTLVFLVSKWAGIDPYRVQFRLFGGSGYDIACAGAEHPIMYSRYPGPSIDRVDFNPPFSDRLFFVYQNRKQDSREGIEHFEKALQTNKSKKVEQFNALTDGFIKAKEQSVFNELMKAHEEEIGAMLSMQPVQQQFFPDFQGAIKSLGAWGGDFMLASHTYDSEDEMRDYFKEKGYETVLSYSEMVL